MSNHASYDSQVTARTCLPWWGDGSRIRHRPVHQMSRSHLEVKDQKEYCLMGLPCPAHISTMHHGIPKLLGMHAPHDEVKCRAQDSDLNLKGQRSKWVTMHHRIPKLLWHMFTMLRWSVAHKIQAWTLKVKVTLRGHRSKWETMRPLANNRSLLFPAYNKSVADDFENVVTKTWKISMKERLIVKQSWKHCGQFFYEQFHLWPQFFTYTNIHNAMSGVQYGYDTPFTPFRSKLFMYIWLVNTTKLLLTTLRNG